MRAELFAVMTKELRQTTRDKRMLLMLLLAPVLQLTLLGFAVNLDVDHIETVILDHDQSPTSRRLVRGLTADPTLNHIALRGSPSAVMASRSAKMVVIIPPGIGSDLSKRRPASVQVLVDATNPIIAQAAVDHAGRYIQWAAVQQLDTGPTIGPVVTIEPRILYNPSMRSPVYMIPGVAAVVLLLVTTVVTAMSIAKERELGTIEQLLVTPLRPSVLLLGKILPYAGIGLVTAGMVLGVGLNLFSVPMRGPLLLIFIGTILYLLTTLGVGVFISTIAKTQQQAILGGFFFLMPAILLSGFMSPIENMPQWIQPLTFLNPARYYVRLLRACLLKGAGFAELWEQLLALFVFGVAILSFASSRFQKRVS